MDPIQNHGVSQSVASSNNKAPINEDILQCDWGEHISTKGISKHFSECKLMKKKYNKLFMLIDTMITKDAQNIQEWVNLKLMFKFLESHIKMMINKENKRPTHFKDKNLSSPSQSNNNNHLNSHQEEDKDEEEKFNSQVDDIQPEKRSIDRYEEEEKKMYIPNQPEICRQDSMQSCLYCNKYITPADEAGANTCFLECAHSFHSDWVKKLIKHQYLDTQKVKWESWDEEVSTYYINALFGPEFIEGLNEQLLKKQLLGSNMVECACHNLIEVVSGSIDYKQKDDDGKVLSKQAAENMAKCRVRCNECSRVFWSKCNVEPYHIGKTWEEFADYRGADKCRFCLEKLNKVRKNCPPAFIAVCGKPECETSMEKWWAKQLEWGHFCWGTENETTCLPCLDADWVNANPEKTLGNWGDDYCNICWMGGLGQGPCVQLGCKHLFHEDCLLRVLKGKWSGPRINFSFIQCPHCKERMSSKHPEIKRLIKNALKLEKNINEMSLKRAKHEGIDKDDRLKDPPYSGDLESYAMARLSYYMCFKCKKPYFGGLKSWENNQQQNLQNFKREELVWAACSADAVGGGIKNCKAHGRDYIEFKWKFCCKIAQWFCWGSTHFCDDWHTKQNNGDYVTKKKLSDLPQCKGKKSWPLKVDHPQNGKEEFAVGWIIWRNMKDNQKDY